MEPTRLTLGPVMAKLREPSTSASISQPSASTLDAERMPDVPVHYRRWALADYDPAVAEGVEPFFRRQKWAVFLTGCVGTRKSSIAAAVLRHWRAMALPSNHGYAWGEFVPMHKLAAAARDFANGPVKLDAWTNAAILVLDDIGAVRSTPHIVETVLHLVLHRYDRDLPLIATSNLSLPELAQVLDERAASRLQEGVVLDLGTKDRRAGV